MERERGEPKDRERGEFHPLRRVHGGMKVIAKSTGKPLSKHPLSSAMAHKQLAAIEWRQHGGHD